MRQLISNVAHFGWRSAREALEATPILNAMLTRPTDTDAVHARAGAAWLRRSIAAAGGAGSAHSYIVLKGWRPAYPETSGYILKTFLRLADWEDRDANERIATALADWLISLQLESGGIKGFDLARESGPVVFDTGMVLLGWNAMFRRTQDKRYLDAGCAAGDFLIGCLDDAGCFVRNTSHGMPHTYDCRVGWALIELGQLAGRKQYLDAGTRNLNWTLRQENLAGFFRGNAFTPGGNSLTHGIGYVLSALMESYLLTGNSEYLRAVRRSCDILVDLFRTRGRLVAELGEDWSEQSSHVCVTGYCQLAIVLLQLWDIDRKPELFHLAGDLIEHAKRTQWLGDGDAPYDGAIPGSYPIYGRYARLQYPNWATKFFVDALLLKMKLEQRERVPDGAAHLDLAS